MATVERERVRLPHIPLRTPAPPTVDARALEDELRGSIRGEVRFDAGSRALYATDGSNYRQVPIGVVIPREIEDAVRTVAACRRYGAPILARGGGTSLAGQCCNVAVVIDMSKYVNRVIAVDPQRRMARVQPGTILDDLRHAAERHGLTFGPDPATHDHCTLGGMIGNNSCGIHSVMAANNGTGPRTSDNIQELEVLTYDGLRMRVGPTGDDELERIIHAGGRRGEIYRRLKTLRDTYADRIRERYPKIPRRVSGYNLDELLPENGFNVARALAGSEGTCVTILEATVCLIPAPKARSLLVLGYPDVYSAGDHLIEVMDHKPIGCEGMDDRLIGYMQKKDLRLRNIKLLPDGGGWLLVEFGGDSKQESDDRARALMEALKQKGKAPSMKLFDDADEEGMLWKVRESGLGATAFVPGMHDTWPGWEDSAVPPERVGDYLRDLRHLFDEYGYDCSLYGHFGQGCIHVRIDFDLRTHHGIEHYRSFLGAASDLVLSYGGSLSGEHGDGQARAALLSKMFGDDLVQAFREFKAIWDPDWQLNPGKVVDPYRPTENLRLGTDYNPAHPRTHFAFPEDQGDFSKATLRCVGVGKCRRLGGGGTMCPSFMATREEMHSTRGRAHLLFEMLRGEVIGDGWRDENVKEALDLCLACKGCKGDCPVNVDMATYKAEFLSHYYDGRLRPRHAYAFGLIFYWARLAALMPGVANFLTHAPLLRTLAKLAANVAPERRIPAFANETLVAWFRRRERTNGGRSPANDDGTPQASERVLLWPDTFNNHFHPETGRAAVEVLEAAGCEVAIPDRWLCCGRPLYDFGMLDLAKHLLRDILGVLREEIRAGTPIVVLEPSCAAVFRDELTNLFPHDEDAKRLKQQTYLLSEYLEHIGYQPPKLERKALVHAHCHHKSILNVDAEEAQLQKLGIDYDIPQTGCCGMAGAFGFERGEHYDVSIACGERVLLPAVRQARADTLIIADGFSCREQIAQTTERRALHLAQVIQMALRAGAPGPMREYPEHAYAGPDYAFDSRKVALVGAGAMLGGSALAWIWKRVSHRKA